MIHSFIKKKRKEGREEGREIMKKRKRSKYNNSGRKRSHGTICHLISTPRMYFSKQKQPNLKY